MSQKVLEDWGMNRRIHNIGRRLLAGLAVVCFSGVLWGQIKDTVVRGQVTDSSGAVVPAIAVTLIGSGGAALVAQTNERGEYVFRHLPPGSYVLEVHVKGFQDFHKTDLAVASGQTVVANAQLVVAMEKQKVTVESQANRLSVSSENNASALVLKGEDLNSLSDDPDELQSELQALAGPSVGPNGGQIYIDGFTGGQLPPKSAILEARVNQNPFSAEYDRLGYGRIEITTKPGYAQFHGQSFVNFNNSAFNSRNPFTPTVPPYHSIFFDGNVGGPLGKKASFFLDGGRRNIQDRSIVSAFVLDPSFNPVPFSQAVFAPQTRTEFSPRFDYQMGTNNVLTVRYQIEKNDRTNNGIGQFNLPSLAYDSDNTENSVQMSDTQVVSAKIVNQTRFRYRRETNDQTPLSLDPTIRVVGAFTSGGSSGGKSLDTVNNYEFQNMTSFSFGKHSLAVGGRLRDSEESNTSSGGFNGTFTFPSIAAYQAAEKALQACSGQPVCETGGASQFTLVAGNPLAAVGLFDAGVYAQDDWRIRPKISLSLGLRFETQNDINDHADFAPRLGLAWGLGRGVAPKMVLRAGAGVFYDRFGEGQVLQALRRNGIIQQDYIVPSPTFFPNIPQVSDLGAVPVTQKTVYRIAPSLQAPYTIQGAVGLERQVTKTATVSVTYLKAHGVHQLLTRNINAPLPGTFDPADPSSGVRPFGPVGNIYQYESDGLFNQDQLIANYNVRAGTKLSLFGFYSLSYAKSNATGAGSFPMNSYDIAADYGRAAFDVRHRVFLGGTIGLARGFRLSPFMMASSGSPYNISVGQDLNGDSIFNDRPGVVSPGTAGPNVVATSLGTFDLNPLSGETILGPNFAEGPGQFSLNMRLAKTFGFGEKKGETGGGGFGGGRGGGPRGEGLGGRGLSGGGGGGGGFWGGQPTNRRYNLEFSLMAHNVFNFVNLATPVGNLTSPLFGKSNSIAGGFFSSQAANRRLDLMMRFTF